MTNPYPAKPSFEQLLDASSRARGNLENVPPVPAPDQTLAEACYHALKTTAQLQAELETPHPGLQKIYARHILADLRNIQIRLTGFAVITRRSINWMANIIRQQHALEIGAGPGLISAELLAAGCRITATDPHPPGHNLYGFSAALTDIENVDAITAIRQHDPQILIRSWPGPKPYTHHALATFSGPHFIYVGERSDGSWATSEFFSILNQHFTLRSSFSIPQFPNEHDRCHHFTRHLFHTTSPAT